MKLCALGVISTLVPGKANAARLRHNLLFVNPCHLEILQLIPVALGPFEELH